MKPVFKERSSATTQKHIESLVANPNPDVVMIGTSMIERFQYDDAAKFAFTTVGLDTFSIFNGGVGGDKLCNVLYRLQNLQVLSHVKTVPRLVIIECGANDIDRKKLNTVEILDGFTQIIKTVRSQWPDKTEIAVLGIFPRRTPNVKPHDMLTRISNLNIELRIVAVKLGCTFHDWSSDVMVDETTMCFDDFVDDVHFSASGYLKFAKRIRDLIGDLIFVAAENAGGEADACISKN